MTEGLKHKFSNQPTELYYLISVPNYPFTRIAMLGARLRADPRQEWARYRTDLVNYLAMRLLEALIHVPVDSGISCQEIAEVLVDSTPKELLIRAWVVETHSEGNK